MDELMSIKDAATKWNICERRIRQLCKEGRIEGIRKVGNVWLIPEKVERPIDRRIKSGKYLKN